MGKLNQPDIKWCSISGNDGKYLCSDFLSLAKIEEFKNKGYVVEYNKET